MSTESIAARTPSDTAPLAEFPDSTVVHAASSAPMNSSVQVVDLHPAVVTVTDRGVIATDASAEWVWLFADLSNVVHGTDDSWTLFDAPGVEGFGVRVPRHSADEFRALLDRFSNRLASTSVALPVVPPSTAPTSVAGGVSVGSGPDPLEELLAAIDDTSVSSWGGTTVIDATSAFVDEVRDGSWPDLSHSFT